MNEYYFTYFFFLFKIKMNFSECSTPSRVVNNVLDCYVIVSGFEPHPSSFVHFSTKKLDKL